MKSLISQAKDIHEEIKGGRRPSLRVPVRSLSNVTFSARKGFFTIGKKVSKRTLSYQTVKPFAQSVRMMAFSKHLINTEDFASKREVY
jgi:DNA topoisomerase-6 subunit A